MSESGKSSSIVNSFSTVLLEVWEKWDVRAMVLFSLTLQIVLSYLGWRRKYTINPFSKTILWFAYLGADWIAIATLSKLSSSYAESPTTNVLRAYWAPLLLLHLGGPDTIIAYSFEDNKLWIRHLLVLIVKAIFVVYVVCLSWTFSWLSFLSLPLILAGIIKYVEKILCLKLNNSQKTKPVIFNNSSGRGPPPIESPTLTRLQVKRSKLLGYLLFTILRPDVNDYHSSHSFSSTKLRIQTCVKKTIRIDDPTMLFSEFEDIFPGPFDMFAVELEFIYDVVYTKVALIYTKLGCSLRLTSFVSSLSVLLLFFINIINEPEFHFSRVDIAITGILLTGAIALEFYAAWVMLSSNWAVFVAAFHHNVLVRTIFCVALKRFPWLFHPSKSWSNKIGQFDLLNYCWLYKKKKGADKKENKKKKGNQSCGILQKITNNDLTEMWHKYRSTKFRKVPSYLKDVVNFLSPVTSFIVRDSIQASRGQKALNKKQYEHLKWSIKLDFDYSIIIWHLATSVCYYQEHQGEDGNDDNDDEAKISKKVSDYMMYLLAMCPALILPDQSKSFWLDHTCDKLKKLLSSATDATNAASTLLSNLDNINEEIESSDESTMGNPQGDVSAAIDIRNVASRETKLKQILKRDVFKLATFLKQLENDKWELIRDVWIEMLVYAAVSSQNISHVKQIGEGIELLSLIWLFVDLNIIIQSIDRNE